MRSPLNIKRGPILLTVILGCLILFPVFSPSPYLIHIITLIFIWSYVSTAWSYMGRFGLVSLGHGAFLGTGAYITALLFNFFNLSPWIGMLIGASGAVFLAAVLGYACFRSGIIGDYFALVTLAVGELVALSIIAMREITGGSLGFTLRSLGNSPLYFQFGSKVYFYYISLLFLLFALYLWKRIDKSKMQKALKAIGEDEVAASSVGINIIRHKMAIFIISAFLTGIGGVLYAQYITYLNPHTLSGVTVSLAIPFKAILGGMFNIWGPAIGTAMIVSLEEYIRVSYGTKFVGVSEVVYGIALITLIIFLPKGLYGTVLEIFHKRQRSAETIT
ncbi:MAG: branched-chain amino acid ABC transporter permease [Deltaproteobacteria bacterium]|nr:MAG: branched-chain amino acid ABC transporter permease [Deltaproteobacteria bacterium]